MAWYGLLGFTTVQFPFFFLAIIIIGVKYTNRFFN